MKMFWKNKITINSGMTVLELLSVLVIIGVLVAIGTTNFLISSKRRTQEAELMTNMRTLQIMLETYRVDWEQYPENITTLAFESSNKNYNKKVTNPFTKMIGPVGASGIWAIDFVPLPALPPELYFGRVGYQRVNPHKYYLYGYNGDAVFLKRSGVIYTVTNGEKEP